ncbi:DUF4136 domain-containing protein [Hydromonas duriensis]|uniref:Uncharacterized protein DUF4136 n=1 Tax=Hydromonas duriensis TaxID=1527608 RepID=A0A4V3DK79_9BURK|nr:DUF4136 domain-containing protein [Hydromonas duriensis]TDR33070.1 uncharacterized protein DUF4136 [Hydromonas duriensis]
MRTKLIQTLCSTAVAYTLLTGCASVDVSGVARPGTDFSKYHTYSYFSPLGTDKKQGTESMLTSHLKEYVNREMQARGFTLTNTKPQLLVNLNTNITQETYATTSFMPAPTYGVSGYYGYRYGLYDGFGGAYTTIRNYDNGTLNIDLVDTNANQLVWEGVAQADVTGQSLSSLLPLIDKAVAKTFTKLPAPITSPAAPAASAQ